MARKQSPSAPQAKPFLLASATLAASTIIEGEAGVRSFDETSAKDRKGLQVKYLTSILTPLSQLNEKVTQTRFETDIKASVHAVFLADAATRQPDPDKAKSTANAQTAHLMKAMIAFTHGFRLDVANKDAKPEDEIDSWSKYRLACADFCERNRLFTPKTKNGKVRKPKTPKAPKSDAPSAPMDKAKVPGDEQRAFVDMCKGNPNLANAIYLLAQGDMPRARRFAVAFTNHYAAIDNEISKLVSPQPVAPASLW